MKKCPGCGEFVGDSVSKCFKCKYDFDAAKERNKREVVKFCQKCRDRGEQRGAGGYWTIIKADVYTCGITYCGGKLVDVDIPSEDVRTLMCISRDGEFIDTMVDLRKRDIVEYQSRMAQLRGQAQIIQQQQQQVRSANSAPKCPICGSSDLKKITITKRAVKTAFFGMIGAVDDAGKTWQCNTCKSKF